jgi:acetyl-CoA carboxylase carboxyl transferase subunit alpha
MAVDLRTYLKRQILTLAAQPIDELLERRYLKFRAMGRFLEQPAAVE